MSAQEGLAVSLSTVAFYAAGVIGGITIGYCIGSKWGGKSGPTRCNHHVKLDQDKVVDTVDMEDIGEKQVFCRCWQSKKFPYCDGSHVNHNKCTKDNVGPLIIKNTKAVVA